MGPAFSYNKRMEKCEFYTIEDLRDEVEYINNPEGSLSVDPQNNWLYRASEAAAESLANKYESNPEEEFYANQ